MVLTIFSIPKPFRGEAERLQMNAVQSWRASNPAARIVLCGDGEGIAELAVNLSLEHLRDIELSEFGTPLISSVFQKVISLFPSDYYVYINGDIMLLAEIEPITKQIPFGDFLGVVRRINLDVEETLDFRGDWLRYLEGRLASSGVLDSPRSIDFFLFRRSPIWEDLPSFIVGRPYWDNWMIFSARKNRIPVVDLTPKFKIIHQNHGYTHIPHGTGRLWWGPEADHNRHLVIVAGCVDKQDRVFTIGHASHILTTEGVKKKSISYNMLRDNWHVLPLLYPRLAPMLEVGQQITLWAGKQVRKWRRWATAR